MVVHCYVRIVSQCFFIIMAAMLTINFIRLYIGLGLSLLEIAS